MAKDILYINDGAAVNIAWTSHIVISSDGVKWDAIPIAGLMVGIHPINLNTTAPNSFPERNKESGWVITLKRNDNEGVILKFNPSKVLNQAGWVAGTPLANAQAAMADILTWLA